MHSVQQRYIYGEKSDPVIPAKAGIQTCIVSTKYLTVIHSVQQHYTNSEKTNPVIPAQAGI